MGVQPHTSFPGMTGRDGAGMILLLPACQTSQRPSEWPHIHAHLVCLVSSQLTRSVSPHVHAWVHIKNGHAEKHSNANLERGSLIHNTCTHCTVETLYNSVHTHTHTHTHWHCIQIICSAIECFATDSPPPLTRTTGSSTLSTALSSSSVSPRRTKALICKVSVYLPASTPSPPHTHTHTHSSQTLNSVTLAVFTLRCFFHLQEGHD